MTEWELKHYSNGRLFCLLGVSLDDEAEERSICYQQASRGNPELAQAHAERAADYAAKGLKCKEELRRRGAFS